MNIIHAKISLSLLYTCLTLQITVLQPFNQYHTITKYPNYTISLRLFTTPASTIKNLDIFPIAIQLWKINKKEWWVFLAEKTQWVNKNNTPA